MSFPSASWLNQSSGCHHIRTLLNLRSCLSLPKVRTHVSSPPCFLYDAPLIVVETFGIQPGTELAAEIRAQLTAAEALALQETKLTPNELADGTKLYLVSRGGFASGTFTSAGSVLPVRGTCNQDGTYVCIGKQAPPRIPGPYEFVVEGRCIQVYRLKELVWQCGE